MSNHNSIIGEERRQKGLSGHREGGEGEAREWGEAREDFLEKASKGERETRTNNRSWLGTAGR